jgi:hypothetical protein
MDNMPGKNIGIARPRSNPPRPNKSVADKASFTFQRANSTMNSFFNSGSFGAPNSQNRKQRVYNQTPINSFALFSRRQKKHGVRSTSQQNVEAQVGQMSRLARIKAKAIKGSKPTGATGPTYSTVETNVTPDTATWVNSSDGTAATGEYATAPVTKAVDGDNTTFTYTNNGAALNKSTSLHFPANNIGDKLIGLKIEWKNYGKYNPALKFGVANGGTVNSLNMTEATSDGNLQGINTGTVATFVNMTDWHLERMFGVNGSAATLTTTIVKFEGHEIKNGDTIYVQAGKNSGGITHFQVCEYTFILNEQL